ncbi:MAG TPA: type II toxin-antitoxin system HicB family antitoxin [bacterium]|nr:type II toxin-antitoxin system HicB family antitoxin [bacterium]
MGPYRFTVELYPDKEEGGYTAIVPSLPGCVTQGDTLDQTLERAREAIEGYMECLKEEGKEIPVEEEPEGRFKVIIAA